MPKECFSPTLLLVEFLCSKNFMQPQLFSGLGKITRRKAPKLFNITRIISITSVSYGLSSASLGSISRLMFILILLAMSSRYVFLRYVRTRWVSGWLYVMAHSRCSFRLLVKWHGGRYDYRIYFLWYQVGMARLPF